MGVLTVPQQKQNNTKK